MKDEEKLVGQLIKVTHHKNNYNKATPLDEPTEVVVVACFKDSKLDGYLINGGLFLTTKESEEYL